MLLRTAGRQLSVGPDHAPPREAMGRGQHVADRPGRLHRARINEKAGRDARPLLAMWTCLEATSVGHDVLLMYGRRHELVTVPPCDVLHVVGVGPEGMENVVRTYRDVGVVADEPTAELIASVDWMGRYKVARPSRQISHRVIQPSVVDISTKLVATDSSDWRRRARGAALPGRYDVRRVGRHVNPSRWRYGD